MKRSSILLIALLAIAADKTPFSVQRVLTNAVISERAAAARYDAFAVKADEEGYPGAAALFRAEAEAERIHLGRFTHLMKERDLAVPPDEASKINVGTTRENLSTAASLEQGERDGSYLYAINVCNEWHDSAAAQLFDVTRDAEVEHANLDAAAGRDLNSMKTLHQFYVCQHCGYTTEVRLPLCPSCRDEHALTAKH